MGLLGPGVFAVRKSPATATCVPHVCSCPWEEVGSYLRPLTQVSKPRAQGRAGPGAPHPNTRRLLGTRTYSVTHIPSMCTDAQDAVSHSLWRLL